MFEDIKRSVSVSQLQRKITEDIEKSCGSRVAVDFERISRFRLGRIFKRSDGSILIKLNPIAFGEKTPGYDYLISYVLEYLNICDSVYRIPKDYPEGLACADVLCRLARSKGLGVSVPLTNSSLFYMKCSSFYPADLLSSFRALEKTIWEEQEYTEAVRCFASAPEILRSGRISSSYASLCSIRRLTETDRSKLPDYYLEVTEVLRSSSPSKILSSIDSNADPLSTGLACVESGRA